MCAPFELAENMSEQREPLSVSRATSIPLMRKLHERSDSSQAIRSRLLTRLGIEKETVVSAVSARTEVSRVVQKGQEEAYNVALKADHGRPDRCLEEKNTIEALATSPGAVDCVLEKQANRGSVCFDASVKVHPIPARSDYSQRMRSVLWVPQIEIQQNVARNTLEFAAEEWDISKVVDDEDMIMYGGELVHPIHFVQECDMNQHFSNIIAHQQQEEKVER